MVGIAFLAGCERYPVREPEIKISIQETIPLDDPNHDNCVVLTIIHTPESPHGFTVYRSAVVHEDAAFTTKTNEPLEAEIGEYVEHILASDTSRIGILIECDGSVPTHAVETVKRGIRRSKTSTDRPLFVGIRDVVAADN